jgi:hypothetical protein
MRKTFAAGAATFWTTRRTRLIHANRRICQLTPPPNTSGRAPHQAQTIDYLDQRCVEYRDQSHFSARTRGRATVQPRQFDRGCESLP